MAARGAARRVHEIFVSRLPWTAGTNEVRDYFAQFGIIRACRMNYDSKTGFSKGFAFVSFSSEHDLEKVLQKEQHVIDGQKVGVQRRQTEASVGRLQISEVFNPDSDSDAM
ncbi:SRA stem-loop-interacting RNA-binding protein, mitochondrial-like [Acanthaster planci]|uniref:SRA stem-loop-interacting RNA-binding protein, mitochondrial-like n=1 Tax=Acanthaster planci TaxID=133434 RepID=A0A8B7Y339_ACAPL|nr:SRA stem-loop-interacting RNA-binding protein, mitochondrial-like [Acanthaster planci]